MGIEGNSQQVCQDKPVYKEIYGLEVVQKHLCGNKSGAPEQDCHQNQYIVDKVFLIQFDKNSDRYIIFIKRD